jgi:hypothetical protein
MGAKAVDFKRGIGSKASLDVGLPGLLEFKKYIESKGYAEFEQQEEDTPDRKTVGTFLPLTDKGVRDYQAEDYFEVYKDLDTGKMRINYNDADGNPYDWELENILRRIRDFGYFPRGQFKELSSRKITSSKTGRIG